MATVLFAAAGAAFGSGFGGTVLGLSGAVIGRAVGATVGRAIDQRVLGLGSEPVEVGRVDRFRLMGASEGTPVARTWGRMRLPGQVIWASPFHETTAQSGGGKGAPKPRSVQFSYSVSLAIALCEGKILGIGRIWADGAEIEPASLNLRVYTGSNDQLPDPAIEADLGFGLAPSYRDTAYVVIENMDLSPFGNRVPQLSFEVIRQPNSSGSDGIVGFDDMIRAVALIPGTGEYALATDKVRVRDGVIGSRFVNVNSRAGVSNFTASFDQLTQELPNCEALSLVVSWFGDDLRCDRCKVQPKVEQARADGINMPWRSGGIGRLQAAVMPQQGDRPIYGGTPADASVVQAIRAASGAGRKIMFYPFILMDQLSGNDLDDPYGTDVKQPVLPWRGRITLSVAPGRAESPDLSLAAEAEVRSFFGTAEASDFSLRNGTIQFTGLGEWKYRRFILHYAWLCKLAGGVEAFCIGSELRGLTQIRGPNHTFPAVAELKRLAADVRSILGPNTKISYAADWSEYFGYHAYGNVYFNLDPLWSDPDIDFIGIDNYMPMSDWRDGTDHADAGWRTIADIGYLKSGIAGGEGYDWYYASAEHRKSQTRTPIEDAGFDEPWVFRYKDLRSWWSNPHHDRVDGQRSGQPTAWVPGSKPIWFTEYGCAALDKATNEPNKFLDSKSSESSLPSFSNGERDDYLQSQYYRAMHEYWNDAGSNPESTMYQGRMVDTTRLFAWAWDARPYPEFPRNEGLWSDGQNYDRGHWLNGRVSSVSIANLVNEVFGDAGMDRPQTADLHGLVSGYTAAEGGSVRAILQPLSVTFGFDSVETNGTIKFISRGLGRAASVDVETIVTAQDNESSLQHSRSADAEIIGRARLSYVSANGDFAFKLAESFISNTDPHLISQSDFSISLTEDQAKSTVDRWLAEAHTGLDSLKVRLPLSACAVQAGSTVEISGVQYRVDRIDSDTAHDIEAVRIETSHYVKQEDRSEALAWPGYDAPSPISPIWMDLPLLLGTETPHAPHIAVSAVPWPGSVAVWDADADDGYRLLTTIEQPSVIGVTLSTLSQTRPGVLDRGPALRVELKSGELSSVQLLSLLNGSNCLAIGDGLATNWELIQFRDAVLVGRNTYDLSYRLRGLTGTETALKSQWPVGSIVVVIDSAIQQVPMRSAFRNIPRNYRVGDATRGYDDDASTHHVLAFQGIGLRPLRVAHLVCKTRANGDCHVSWVRQTRLDGDSWDAFEVPVAEAAELYEVTLASSSFVADKKYMTSVPYFIYTRDQMLADGVSEDFEISVSQVSSTFGPGLSLNLPVHTG